MWIVQNGFIDIISIGFLNITRILTLKLLIWAFKANFEKKNYRFIIFQVVLQSVENHQLGLKTHRFVSISIIFFLKIKEKMMDVLSTYERKIYCEEKYKEKRRRDPWSFQCPAENPSLVHNVARNLLKIVLKVLYHWFHEAISLQLLKLILNGKDSLFYK